MATVINRTTLELRERISISLYQEPEWKAIHTKTIGSEAAVEAIKAIPVRYRKIDGTDNIVEMSQAEKDAVDAATLETARNNLVAQIDNVEDVLRASLLSILDELNAHSLKINAILNAIDGASNLAEVKSAIAAIPDSPPRSIAQLKTAIRNKLGI